MIGSRIHTKLLVHRTTAIQLPVPTRSHDMIDRDATRATRPDAQMTFRVETPLLLLMVLYLICDLALYGIYVKLRDVKLRDLYKTR